MQTSLKSKKFYSLPPVLTGNLTGKDTKLDLECLQKLHLDDIAKLDSVENNNLVSITSDVIMTTLLIASTIIFL